MWWRREREDDLERELRSHLEAEAEEQQGDRDAARHALGNLGRVKEDVREAWGWMWLEQLACDLCLGARSARRRPVFTAVAVLSLAIGIGANTAIFSFAEAILIRKLPVRDPERLVILRQQNKAFGFENCCFSYSVFQRLRQKDDDFEDIAALTDNYGNEVAFSENGQSERLLAEFVSGNYFRMLDVRPAAGRLIDEDDDRNEGAAAVAVISDRLWQERFGGRADAVGRQVLINDQQFQIVGVAQPGFTGVTLHTPHDLQIPSSMLGKLTKQSRDQSAAFVIGRLKAGLGREQARARLDAIGKPIQRELGQIINDRDDFLLRDGSQGFSRVKEQFSQPVNVLLLLVGVVLLVACANLTALLLVRSMEGAKETGMRAALGASRWSLLRHSFRRKPDVGRVGRRGRMGRVSGVDPYTFEHASPAERESRGLCHAEFRGIPVRCGAHAGHRGAVRHAARMARDADRSAGVDPRAHESSRAAPAAVAPDYQRADSVVTGAVVLRGPVFAYARESALYGPGIPAREPDRRAIRLA